MSRLIRVDGQVYRLLRRLRRELEKKTGRRATFSDAVAEHLRRRRERSKR